MILVDFGSVMYRNLHAAIRITNPHKQNGFYKTGDYIGFFIHQLFSELYNYKVDFKEWSDEIILCLESKHNFRKEIFGDYKKQRKISREHSDINFDEFFKHVELLEKIIRDYTEFKILRVDGLEGDDIIATLIKTQNMKSNSTKKILILSCDKDFKQLLSENVRQFSTFSNKWIENENAKEWELKHVCLGDVVDCVPRIIDFSIFKPEFKEFLNSKNINISESEFYDLKYQDQIDLISEHLNIQKNETFLNLVFVKERFGIKTLQKKIVEYGNLDNFLNSNSIYRKNYERNKKLVLFDFIPKDLSENVIKNYESSISKTNIEILTKYFTKYQCFNILEIIKNDYRKNLKSIELTFDNCGW